MDQLKEIIETDGKFTILFKCEFGSIEREITVEAKNLDEAIEYFSGLCIRCTYHDRDCSLIYLVKKDEDVDLTPYIRDIFIDEESSESSPLIMPKSDSSIKGVGDSICKKDRKNKVNHNDSKNIIKIVQKPVQLKAGLKNYRVNYKFIIDIYESLISLNKSNFAEVYKELVDCTPNFLKGFSDYEQIIRMKAISDKTNGKLDNDYGS